MGLLYLKSSGTNARGSTSTSQLAVLSSITPFHAVRPLRRLLQERHALGAQLLIGLAAVVDLQAEPAHLALLQLGPDERGGRVVQRRARRPQRGRALGAA